MPRPVRTTAPTGSSLGGGGTGSCRASPRISRSTTTPSPEPGFFTAAVRPDRAAFEGPAFPAARAPGFALARDFGADLAAGAPFSSAFAAALAALFAGRPAPAFRFSLRFPGRELGRFPSTPPSSVMDGDSISARSGYTAPAGPDDRVGRGFNWLTG